MRILRDVAKRERWRVRSTNAYTRQGTYLPQQMPGHVADVEVHIVPEDAVMEDRVEQAESGGAVRSIGDKPETKQEENAISSDSWLGLALILAVALCSVLLGLIGNWQNWLSR